MALPIVPFVVKSLLKNGLKLLAKKVGIGGKDAVKVLCDTLGVDADDKEAVASSISNQSKEILTLREQEISNEIDDRKSAREREVAIVKATGEKENYMYILASVIVIGFFGLLVVIVTMPLPDVKTNILYLLVGTLVMKFGSIVDYFFGSSKSSSDKNDILGILKSKGPVK